MLVSRHFFYFGENAIKLPKDLKHIIIDRQGFWKLDDKDITKLMKYLKEEKKDVGVHGTPCNLTEEFEIKC